jgi:anaerobic magnesium-protoporphyrin IX monomethyl ester cyclase
MKILACNPPFLPKFSRESRSPAVAKSGTLYYPMWLAYAVGYLEKLGHEVLFLDAAALEMSIEDVCAKAREFNPALAILDTSTPSIYSDIAMAQKLKAAVPGLCAGLVGVHVSALPEETLRGAPDVDFVAFGEYDATLAEAAEAIAAGRGPDFSKVKGLAFRNGKGAIVKNEARPFIGSLDDFPFVSEVYKRHLDISPYFYSHSRYPLIVFVTGRGCPFHCTYCVVPQTLHGHNYRKRSVENIVAEFQYIAKHFPEVREIMIEDDTLTADPKRCRALAQALIDAKAAKIPWSANSRADIDYETMAIMKKAGCRLFCVGFESGEQQILDNIRKATKIPKIRQFMKDARKAGILVHGCFMVGNRGESRQTLESTLRFAKELNPDTAQFYPIMAYPGTADFAYFEERGWIVTHDYRKWLTEDGLHSSVVSNPDLTYEELVKFCDRARKEFYLRPRYMFQKGVQVLRHPSEAPRLFKAFRTFVNYLFTPSIKPERCSTC